MIEDVLMICFPGVHCVFMSFIDKYIVLTNYIFFFTDNGYGAVIRMLNIICE